MAIRSLTALGLILFTLLSCSPHDEAAALNQELEEAAKTNQTLRIEPGVGVGPMKFGMTPDQLVEVVGEPYRKTGSAWEYQHLGLAVLFDDRDRINAILAGAFCEPSDVLLDVFKGETAEGLRLRASRKEAVAAFGEPLLVKILDSGFEVLQYENAEFAFRGGELVHMTWRSPG